MLLLVLVGTVVVTQANKRTIHVLFKRNVPRRYMEEISCFDYQVYAKRKGLTVQWYNIGRTISGIVNMEVTLHRPAYDSTLPQGVPTCLDTSFNSLILQFICKTRHFRIESIFTIYFI